MRFRPVLTLMHGETAAKPARAQAMTITRSAIGGEPTLSLGLALWGTDPVSNLVAQAQRAERMGLESVWVIDSQLICREVFVTMAAILAATSRIRVATGVTNPKTRHVSATACALATLNEMYPGRVLAGLGTGFSSLRTIGRRRARLAEFESFASDLRDLLGGRPCEFEGGVSGRIAWLGGTGNVPVLLAASGPQTTRLAGRIADGIILLQGVADDLVARAAAWVTDGRSQGAATSNSFSVTCWVPFGVAEASDEARAEVRPRVASALMQARPEHLGDDDREVAERLRAAYDSFAHADRMPAHATLIPDDLIARYAVAGSPSEVVTRLGHLIANPHLDRIVLTPQGGQRSLDDTLAMLEDQVLPALSKA